MRKLGECDCICQCNSSPAPSRARRAGAIERSMQIPADRLQRDLPECRCNVILKELRRATQREAGYDLPVPNTAPQFAKDAEQRVRMRRQVPNKLRRGHGKCGVRTDGARQGKT